MNQTVEVTATSPLIDNATASNGLVIDSQKLENLPNAGRNPFFFSKLDNNVTQVGDPRFVRFQDQSGSSTISLAGGPISGNNYEIDNIPITDFSNRAVIIPSIEAVNEVKVQQNSYDAEMGRTGGGVFNTTLKSGSNTLHGVLQGETRQTQLGCQSLLQQPHHPTSSPRRRRVLQLRRRHRRPHRHSPRLRRPRQDILLDHRRRLPPALASHRKQLLRSPHRVRAHRRLFAIPHREPDDEGTRPA